MSIHLEIRLRWIIPIRCRIFFSYFEQQLATAFIIKEFLTLPSFQHRHYARCRASLLTAYNNMIVLNKH